jgi:hypothetical protein
MHARIVSSVSASITRASIPWQRIRFFHRESKVGGHTVRSVPVRGGTETLEAPAAPVHSVVENEDLQQAMVSLNISELTEIQARFHIGSQDVHSLLDAQPLLNAFPQNRARYRSWPIP